MVKSISAVAAMVALLGAAPAYANSEQYGEMTPSIFGTAPQRLTGGAEAYPVTGGDGVPMQANLASSDVGSEAAPAFTGRALDWAVPSLSRLAAR